MQILSEDHILSCLWTHFSQNAPQLLVPNGDDCAVLHDMGPLCVSTDLFIEDVHFRSSYFSMQDIGHKALAVNLSDLAACGAKPVGFTLGLAMPPSVEMQSLDALFLGMAELAKEHDVPLIGGDISKADKVHLCITVFGISEAPKGALLRGNAKAGDMLFVLGQVGLARVGLERLEREGVSACARFPESCRAHLRPKPRVREGLKLAALANRNNVSLSLMDLSDGLARDLPRLVGPGLGAEIHLNGLHAAQHPEVVRHTQEYGIDPIWFAFQGGEDYALLGVCPSGQGAALMAVAPEAIILGSLIPVKDHEPRWLCNGMPMSGGFDHFDQSGA